jgi:hypothetical protein
MRRAFGFRTTGRDLENLGKGEAFDALRAETGVQMVWAMKVREGERF